MLGRFSLLFQILSPKQCLCPTLLNLPNEVLPNTMKKKGRPRWRFLCHYLQTLEFQTSDPPKQEQFTAFFKSLDKGSASRGENRLRRYFRCGLFRTIDKQTWLKLQSPRPHYQATRGPGLLIPRTNVQTYRPQRHNTQSHGLRCQEPAQVGSSQRFVQLTEHRVDATGSTNVFPVWHIWPEGQAFLDRISREADQEGVWAASRFLGHIPRRDAAAD